MLYINDKKYSFLLVFVFSSLPLYISVSVCLNSFWWIPFMCYVSRVIVFRFRCVYCQYIHHNAPPLLHHAKINHMPTSTSNNNINISIYMLCYIYKYEIYKYVTFLYMHKNTYMYIKNKKSMRYLTTMAPEQQHLII